MKKTFSKVIALLIAIAMMSSMAGCSAVEKLKDSSKPGHLSSKNSDKDEDDDDDEEDDDEDKDDDKESDKSDKEDSEKEDESDKKDDSEDDVSDKKDESDKSVIIDDVDVDGFQFTVTDIPSESYSYAKVHPTREPGNLSGEEAVAVLNSVELDFLDYYLDNYVDVTLLLEDYEALGITFDGITMGEVSFDEVDYESVEKMSEWLAELYTIDYESLEENDRLCYDKLVFDMEEDLYISQFTEFNYMTPVFNSFTSLQCDLFFVLDVMDFKTVEDAENYILVLESLKDYFGDLCEYEKLRVEKGYASSDASYDGVIESFENLVAQKDDCFLYESFAQRLEAIEDITEDQKADLIKRHEDTMKSVVFPTFEDCIKSMKECKGNCVNELGLYYYDGGKYLYEDIVRAKSNSQITPKEAIEVMDDMLYGAFIDYVTSIQTQGILDLDFTAGDVQENLDYLYDTVFEYFPEIPEHKYQLRDVPEVFQDSFSPAAYLGFHLDNFDSNAILINTAAGSSNFGTVVAHEGYPGHMYQSLYTRMVSIHPYLILTGSSGYKEGWAQYVEMFSPTFYDATDDEFDYFYAESMVDLLLMARIDLGVNYEGWDAQDAADYLSDLFGMSLFTADSLQNIVDICIADPGYPLPYALGYYQTNRILNDMFDNNPDLSSKEIFAMYLNAQTVTFEQIEASVARQLAK